MSQPQHSNFRALQTINEERSTYGLRYGDYNRYRKHCAAKTHRLRSSLKMTHGKGRDFKKLPPIIPENVKDGHLQLLLFETERAWAHAQELSDPQDARRSTSRYRRSYSYLSRLLTLARSSSLPKLLTSQGLVELFVYALIHIARFNLRRPSASTAQYYTLQHGGSDTGSEAGVIGYPLVQLSVAHALLDELEKSATTSKEVALARAFKDEIGPEIRWCIHEFSRGSNDENMDAELEVLASKWKRREWDTEGIVGDVSPVYAERVIPEYSQLVRGLRAEAALQGDPAGKKQVLEELIWEGEPVPVRNPELVDVLLTVQEAIGKLRYEDEEPVIIKTKAGKGKAARGKMAKYDATLLSLSDAVDAARKLVDAQQVSGSSSITASETGQRDIHFMHSFLTYLHLTYRIERDLILLSALVENDSNGNNNASILHLLSGILQSLSQALTLTIVDESPDLSAALTMRLSHAKAHRALHLARAYGHATQKSYAEAVTLTQRGRLHIREGRSTLSIASGSSRTSNHVNFYPIDDKVIGELEQSLIAEEGGYKRAWFAENGGAVGGSGVGYKKPVFFDIAFNYVEIPMAGLRERAGLKVETTESEIRMVKGKVEAEAETAAMETTTTPAETKAERRGGLTGFLGSWWGRR